MWTISAHLLNIKNSLNQHTMYIISWSPCSQTPWSQTDQCSMKSVYIHLSSCPCQIDSEYSGSKKYLEINQFSKLKELRMHIFIEFLKFLFHFLFSILSISSSHTLDELILRWRLWHVRATPPSKPQVKVMFHTTINNILITLDTLRPEAHPHDLSRNGTWFDRI